MMKKNRRAWLRIVEAFLAIVIISGALLYILSEQPIQGDISEEVYQSQREILNLISKNEGLRADILDGDTTQVNVAITKMIPLNLEFSTNICMLGDVCPNLVSVLDKSVYATEVMIAATPNNYSPKKLRFFVWIK